MQPSKSSRWFMVAVSEWVLLLPAAVFLAAAAARLLQPRQYEPARTSWIIFEWATTHISRTGAAVLFIGLPALVAFVGCAALVAAWRRNQELRQDTGLALAILRRNLVMALLVPATVLAAAILAFAVTHVAAG